MRKALLGFLLLIAGVAGGQIASQDGRNRVWGYLEWIEAAAPGTPDANVIRIYARDKAGVSELFYKNDQGTERDLSLAGGSGGWTRQVQASDVTTTSNAAYSASGGLNFAVSANSNYHGRCRLFTSTAVGTTGLQLQTQGPASPTRVRIIRRYYNNSATALTTISQAAFNSAASDDGAAGSHTTANLIQITEVDLMLEIGGTAGTVTWAIQSEVSGSSVTLYKGSYCEYQDY